MIRHHTLPHPMFTSPRLWRLESTARRRGLSWHVFLLGVVAIVALVAGGFVYIRQVTSTTASGYDVSALERRAEELRVQEATLEFEAAELESLKRVEERLKTLNLVPTEDVAYTSPILRGVVTGQIPVGTARP